jgi:hypothetical protein
MPSQSCNNIKGLASQELGVGAILACISVAPLTDIDIFHAALSVKDVVVSTLLGEGAPEKLTALSEEEGGIALPKELFQELSATSEQSTCCMHKHTQKHTLQLVASISASQNVFAVHRMFSDRLSGPYAEGGSYSPRGVLLSFKWVWLI